MTLAETMIRNATDQAQAVQGTEASDKLKKQAAQRTRNAELLVKIKTEAKEKMPLVVREFMDRALREDPMATSFCVMSPSEEDPGFYMPEDLHWNPKLDPSCGKHRSDPMASLTIWAEWVNRRSGGQYLGVPDFERPLFRLALLYWHIMLEADAAGFVVLDGLTLTADGMYRGIRNRKHKYCYFAIEIRPSAAAEV